MRAMLCCLFAVVATAAGCTVPPSIGGADMATGAPDMWGGDDFRASWKDDMGCEFHTHWDGTRCVEDNPIIYKNEGSCWAHGQANDYGVGRPCQPGIRECTGLKASCCQVDDRQYGAVCTLACNADADCGPNAWCSILNVCLPAFCKAGFTAADKPTLYTDAMKGFPCSPPSIPASGLGKACKVGGAECTGLTARYCLGDPAVLGGAPSFCTYACNLDADCGAGAVCIYSEAKPYFCAPSSCAAQFATIDFLQWPMMDSGMSNPVCAKPGM